MITGKNKIENFSITKVKTNLLKDKVSFVLNYAGKNYLYLINPLSKEIQKTLLKEEFIQPIQCHWLNSNTLVILTSIKTSKQQELWLFNIITKEYSKINIPLKSIEEPICTSPSGYEISFCTTVNNLKYLFTYNIYSGKISQILYRNGIFYEKSFWSKDGWIYYSFKENKEPYFKIMAVKEDGSMKKEVINLSSKSNEILLDISQDGYLLAFYSDCFGKERTAIHDLLTKQTIWFGSGEGNEIPLEISNDEQYLLVKRQVGYKTQPVIYNIDTMKQHKLSIIYTISEMHYCVDDEFLIYTRSDYRSTKVIALYDLIEDTEEIVFELNPALY